MNHPPSNSQGASPQGSTLRTARQSRGLLALCILLILIALAGFIAGLWLFIQGQILLGGLVLLTAAVSVAAGVGLYRLRRWGVICFGILSMAGSIQHLAQIFTQYPSLANADVFTALSALLDIFLAILIPMGLLYLTILLWKLTRPSNRG